MSARGWDFDFDFNILTAFIRLGRAGPRRGPGALHIYKIYRHCALQPRRVSNLPVARILRVVAVIIQD